MSVVYDERCSIHSPSKAAISHSVVESRYALGDYYFSKATISVSIFQFSVSISVIAAPSCGRPARGVGKFINFRPNNFLPVIFFIFFTSFCLRIYTESQDRMALRTPLLLPFCQSNRETMTTATSTSTSTSTLMMTTTTAMATDPSGVRWSWHLACRLDPPLPTPIAKTKVPTVRRRRR